jgi:hypothetical protein
MPDVLRVGPSGSDVVRAAVAITFGTFYLIAGGFFLPSAVLALVAGAFAGRSLSLRLVANYEGVQIRNLFRSYRVAWSDIVAIETTDRPLRWYSSPKGIVRHRIVVRTMGGAIEAMATQTLKGGILGTGASAHNRTDACLSRLENFRGPADSAR